MRFLKPIRIGLAILAMQFSAFAGELAVLRNGFTVRVERKEQSGAITRLYTSAGFLDIPTADIASFEPDDDPPEVVAATSAGSAAPGTANTVVAPAAAAQGPASEGWTLPVSTAARTIAPATATPTRANIDQLVRDASSRHRLDPDFVSSVIKYESNFQPRAVSSKGAQGLMQLMPGTASQLGVTNPFDPQANVEGGTAYLSQLLDQYNNDAVKALAAYNAGSHRVDQYHGVPPYAETRAYVAHIVRDYNAKKRAQMNAQSSSAKTAKKTGKKAPATTQPQEAGLPKAKRPA
jgi:soluble lytic murein transglycosylase-like protein